MTDLNRYKPRAITGIWKYLIYMKIIIHVFAVYFFRVLTLRLNPLTFLKMLYRLLLLLKVTVPNKIIRIGNVYKLQLYLPAYPTPAFWESVNKFARPEPGPLTVVFSITKACAYRCPHCYQRNDTGADLNIELLKNTARRMQEVGTTMFDIEGGEPMLKFERLLELLKAFDGRRELWVNTTGHMVTEEKARKMKEAGVFGVMISLHTPDPAEYDKFTGFKNSFEIAREAARIFNQAGITVALNSCPSHELVDRDGIEKIMQLAKDWNCSFVQIIHGKSAGAWLGRHDEMINARERIKKLQNYHILYNSANRYADYPAASVQVYEEMPEHFGCSAGGIDRYYLNANGELQPCEFLNVSFGNVNDEPFELIYRRMRTYFRKPGTNWLCCTEAHSINEWLKKYELKTTPLPWKYTRELLKTWERGEETPLYKKMGIYK